MIIEFFFNNIIKIKKSKYNYHDKIVNNLTYMCTRRVNLYSLERGNKGYPINQKSHELNHWLLNKCVQYIYF